MSRFAWCPLILLLTGCASRSGPVPAPFPRPHRGPSELPVTNAARPLERHAVTATALRHRGVPFVDGGATPTWFDCSGFTYYVFRQHGVQLPRSAADQYRAGTAIDPDAIEPGDLLFFETVAPGASHVGLALGPDEFVHAPSERGRVRVERVSSSYWARRFLGARRILEATD